MHHSKIFLVDKSGQTWLPMTETPYDQEVVLQEALAQYPDLIPGDQINPDNPRRWLLVKCELGIPGRRAAGNGAASYRHHGSDPAGQAGLIKRLDH